MALASHSDAGELWKLLGPAAYGETLDQCCRLVPSPRESVGDGREREWHSKEPNELPHCKAHNRQFWARSPASDELKNNCWFHLIRKQHVRKQNQSSHCLERSLKERVAFGKKKIRIKPTAETYSERCALLYTDRLIQSNRIRIEFLYCVYTESVSERCSD